MPAQYKAPISRDTIVEVVEKSEPTHVYRIANFTKNEDDNGLNKRKSKLGDELEHRDDDHLRLIFADPQIPHKDLKSLESLLPWGFRKMIGRTAGGGTGCCTSLAKGRLEHASWFFFLWQVLEGVESTSRGPRPRTRWSYIDVLISWNSETNVTMVLYLGDLGKITSALRSKLEAAVRSGEVWRDPYAWHRLIIDEVDEIYNERVWALQDFIGRVEADRSPEFYDFDLMHDIGRLLIQSNEVLESAINTNRCIRKSHELLEAELSRFSEAEVDAASTTSSEARLKNGHWTGNENDRMLFYRTHQELGQLGDCFLSTLLFSRTVRDRLQNEINLAFNLVAQRDGQLARIDNMTMKTIAAVTLAFLPGTFVASLFGMNFFDFSPEGGQQAWIVSEKLWIYWAVTLPLTALTLGCWWAWDFGQRKCKIQRVSQAARLRRATTQGEKQDLERHTV